MQHVETANTSSLLSRTVRMGMLTGGLNSRLEKKYEYERNVALASTKLIYGNPRSSEALGSADQVDTHAAFLR